MPSFDLYKKIHGSGTNGEVRKRISDDLMETTWNEDIQSRVVYQFDMYHDPYPRCLNNCKPTKDMIPLDIKYIRHQSQTLAKDQVTYHLQMRPSQRMNVPYYQDYIDKYGTQWPLGEYVLIPDNKGSYNRWLIVDEADINDPQFSTYEILRCDYTFQYVMNGRKCEVAGVLRSQNSYNSGIWTDFKLTSVSTALLCGDTY